MLNSDVNDAVDIIVNHINSLDTNQKIKTLNQVRQKLHDVSPFVNEPVDFVEWLPKENIVPNDYNPNQVAPPEMELLRLSIGHDGFTQPIVTWTEENQIEVVDGFHRSKVCNKYPDISNRLHGHLPLVRIKDDCTGRNDRMASTVRHNRARGKHTVDGMSEIVIELKRRNWSDKRVGKELGMDPDEVLRLTQIKGLADMFSDDEFSEAWEHSGTAENKENELYNYSDGNDDILEWANDIIINNKESGWDDRTPSSSVLYGEKNHQIGTIQKSRFKENEWFWYAYTQPMQTGTAKNRQTAKETIEGIINE